LEEGKSIAEESLGVSGREKYDRGRTEIKTLSSLLNIIINKGGTNFEEGGI